MRSASLFLAALTAAALPGICQDAPKIEFEKFTLRNGLQVILHVDRKLPMVHVNSWYHVGSKIERIGRTGFAHLFEHMMFEGSKDANGKYFGFIEKAGANLFTGGVNGTTSEDRTNYFATVPSANLEYVLWIESDRLATLTDVLTKQKLDNERDIVKNERRQGLENQPYGRAFTLLQQNLFPSGHPYAHDVIGSHEDLTAATVEDVTEFFKTYYTPNNLSLAITGDFDPAQAKRLVEKYFGPIPPGPALDRPKHWIPALDGAKTIEVNDRVPQERTYLAWPAPALFDPDDGVLDLVSAILADGLSSRLSQTLVHDRQLCSSVNAFQNSMEIAGFFAIIATARPGASLAEIERIIGAEISRLAKDGPSAEELNRAKTKWEFGFISGLERIGGFGGQADLLNQYNVYFGDPDRFSADLERHRRVTTDDVRRAVARWLDTPNLVAVRFHPEKSQRPEVTDLDRSKIPALGADRPFHTPEVRSTRLENGIQVFVVERRDLPKVAVTLATRAGSADDPEGMEGLASLAVQVMRRGTTTRKAIAIDAALGDLGTDLFAGADAEAATLGLEVLRRNLSAALEILADVSRNPSFPQDEVDREKKKRLDSLAQAYNNPNAISQRVGAALLYGPTHPYGRPPQGYPSSVAKIEAQDLSKFHAAYWKPGSTALIFAGDIALADAVEMVRRSFGAWSGGAAPEISVPAPQPAGPGKVFLIDRPDAAQTVVSELLLAPPRSAPDYYALSLADTVWGGGAAARLGTNIREEKGYSYGVFSFLVPHARFTGWTASGGVQTAKTKEAVVEFQKELKFIAGEKPVSEDELAGARSNRIRGYAQEFESLGSVAGQIQELWKIGLPTTEMQRQVDELGRVTREAVNSAAEKYANPARATLLLVGDLSKIEAGVRDLKIGEVIVLDPEGQPVKR
jgi:zinc protease